MIIASKASWQFVTHTGELNVSYADIFVRVRSYGLLSPGRLNAEQTLKAECSCLETGKSLHNVYSNTELKQDRQCTSNVKLRRFRLTIVAVEKQYSNITYFSVCVCALACVCE